MWCEDKFMGCNAVHLVQNCVDIPLLAQFCNELQVLP